MRLQSAAPRAHTARLNPGPPTLRRRLGRLLTLSLLGAPALLAGRAMADDSVEAAPAPAPVVVEAEVDPAAAEGVVSLTDAPKTGAPRTDAAVQPAGMLGCHDEGCVGVCDTPPACDGCMCDGGVCNGNCGLFGHGGSGAGQCYGPACGPGCGPGICLPGLPVFTHNCPPGQECPPGYGCPPGVCLPGACPGGICLPGACPGGICLPGAGGPGVCLPGSHLLPGACLGAGSGWLSHLCARCGGRDQCYWCSLSEVDALHGKYEHVYAVNPNYRDRRTGDVWASQQTGVPMAVPLAPNVRYTMEYGWGMPSSRLVPISRPGPPSWLYGPPEGTTVELPNSHPRRGETLPYIPEHGQKHLPRTGVAFPRTIDNAGNR